jgi:hypothetical protein
MDVGRQGLKYVVNEKIRVIVMDCLFFTLNEKFVYNDDKIDNVAKKKLVMELKENLRLWYRWRKGKYSLKNLWLRCQLFENNLEKAGIGGQKITELFDDEMFQKEVWSNMELEKWFTQEKNKNRFRYKDEEILDGNDIIKMESISNINEAERYQEKRLKNKEMRKKKKIKLKNLQIFEEKMIVDENRKKPDKLIHGMIERLYLFTVMGKQRIFDDKARIEEIKTSSEQPERIVSMKSVFRYIAEKMWKMNIINRNICNLRWEKLPRMNLRKMEIKTQRKK